MKYRCLDAEYSDDWVEIDADSSIDAAKAYCVLKRKKDFEYEGGTIDVVACDARKINVHIRRDVTEHFVATATD